MVEHAEPLSLILWAVVAFAASLYPLGFMLGAPCSPCCTSDCDEVFDFNRCIRFVNDDQTEPPEDVALGANMMGPVHGFSVKVSRPEDVGAKRVATRMIVPFEVFLNGTGASSMSDGETRTAIYTYSYNTETGSQTAVRWTITLQGVTMPLDPPKVQTRQFTTTGSSTSTITYRVQLPYVNRSSTPTVSVHSCSVVSGVEWLDGAAVAENDLKAMLTNGIVTDGNGVYVQSVFTVSAAIFQYVPRNSPVVLKYVVEHTRGNTRRYGIQDITVYQRADAEDIPDTGLAPLVIAPRSYVDTPFTRTPPVFAGDTPTTKTATIYTDNLFTSESTTGDISVPFPSVEIRPVGAQLQRQTSGLPLARVQDGEFININEFLGIQTFDKRWIMSPPFYPVAPYALTGSEDPIFSRTNNWIYDYDLVESFLNGETTLPYETRSHGTFAIQVSPQAKYCGDPLYTAFLASMNIRPVVTPVDAIERVVTCGLSPPPESFGWSGDVEDMTLKLSSPFTDGRYDYYGLQSKCVKPNFQTRQFIRGIKMRSFYCGDLLWALENGPCRTSVKTPFASGWGPDEFTLGGDYTLPSVFGTICRGLFEESPITQGPIREANLPQKGGAFNIERPAGDGFPASTFTFLIPENYSKFSVLHHFAFSGFNYITQAGHDNQCNFTVRWLANTLDTGDISAAAFVSENCPIMGQINHRINGMFGFLYYQPGCDWSVTSSASWLIAERVEDGLEEGLLKLSIDNSVDAVFTERNNTRRSATITITSGETTKTWKIEHRRI
jgi:hypothetical protein